MEKTLQELLDLRAIEQLMVRYADRIDANDPQGAAASFAEGGIGKYWGECRGRKEIAARLGKILDLFSATSHHLSNVRIHLDGDQATAMSYRDLRLDSTHLDSSMGSPHSQGSESTRQPWRRFWDTAPFDEGPQKGLAGA